MEGSLWFFLKKTYQVHMVHILNPIDLRFKDIREIRR
jgi:hypothetical protein